MSSTVVSRIGWANYKPPMFLMLGCSWDAVAIGIRIFLHAWMQLLLGFASSSMHAWKSSAGMRLHLMWMVICLCQEVVSLTIIF